jgi:hypothetical protein
MNPLYPLSAGLGSPQFWRRPEMPIQFIPDRTPMRHVRPIGKQRLRAVSWPHAQTNPLGPLVTPSA